MYKRQANNCTSIVYYTVTFEGTQECKHLLIRYYFYFTSVLASSQIVAVVAQELSLGNSDLFEAFAVV